MNSTDIIISEQMIAQIKSILVKARSKVAYEINTSLLMAYWETGRIIVENEQKNNVRAEYGKKILKELSIRLTKELGRGFSVVNLYKMRLFYLSNQIFQTVSVKLTWSHYCELLSISDKDRRSFYEKECANAGWSVRELRQQMESSLFERLLLSSGNANKEKVLALAQIGNEITTPQDLIKNPYVFEFLELPEEKSV